MTLYHEGEGVTLFCADALDAALAGASECDALIVDAPYSERTHGAYREMAAARRSSIPYACWTPDNVRAFVDLWAPRTRGWFVTLTDHVLAPVWEQALVGAGRYVFAPIACVEPGSRVRISGDGPSQWTVWAIVARPKNRAFAKWGALPGAYVVPAGLGRQRESVGVMGGKPEWLMERLVEDYSREGDVVADPCAGGGTTGVAAKRLGRRALLIDVSEEHCAIAAERLRRTRHQERLTFGSGPTVQLELGGGAGR